MEGFNVLKSFGSSASCICSTYRFRTDEILKCLILCNFKHLRQLLQIVYRKLYCIRPILNVTEMKIPHMQINVMNIHVEFDLEYNSQN